MKSREDQSEKRLGAKGPDGRKAVRMRAERVPARKRGNKKAQGEKTRDTAWTAKILRENKRLRIGKREPSWDRGKGNYKCESWTGNREPQKIVTQEQQGLLLQKEKGGNLLQTIRARGAWKGEKGCFEDKSSEDTLRLGKKSHRLGGFFEKAVEEKKGSGET